MIAGKHQADVGMWQRALTAHIFPRSSTHDQDHQESRWQAPHIQQGGSDPYRSLIKPMWHMSKNSARSQRWAQVENARVGA